MLDKLFYQQISKNKYFEYNMEYMKKLMLYIEIKSFVIIVYQYLNVHYYFDVLIILFVYMLIDQILKENKLEIFHNKIQLQNINNNSNKLLNLLYNHQ